MIRLFRACIVFLFVLLAAVACKNEGEIRSNVKKQLDQRYPQGTMYIGHRTIGKKARIWGHAETTATLRCTVGVEVTIKTPDCSTKTVREIGWVSLDVIPCSNYDLDCSDPLVVQVPQEWTGFRGSFRSGDVTDSLVVIEGEIPAYHDESSYITYVPQDGYKTLLIDFPELPDTGAAQYDSVRIDFAAGSSDSSYGVKTIKVISAARIWRQQTGDTVEYTYYPPAIPPEHRFAFIDTLPFVHSIVVADVSIYLLGQTSTAHSGSPDPNDECYILVEFNDGQNEVTDINPSHVLLEDADRDTVSSSSSTIGDCNNNGVADITFSFSLARMESAGVDSPFVLVGGMYGSNAVFMSERITEATASIDEPPTVTLPTTFNLGQNEPNPFSTMTEIRYSLPQSCYVNLTVYNAKGQKVKVLVNRHQTPGHKSAYWDGTDEARAEVGSGIYFCRMEAGEYLATKKVVLLR